MKTVKELYQSVSFDEVKDKIIKSIEESFQSRGTGISISLTSYIAQVIFADVNEEKTVEFFKELKKAGYRFSIKDPDLIIHYELHEPRYLLSKSEKILESLDVENKKTDLNYLTDSNVVNKIIQSITNNSEKWNLIKGASDSRLETAPQRIGKQDLKIVVEIDSNKRVKIKITDIYSNFLILSKKEEAKIAELFESFIKNHNFNQLETITTILNAKKT